MFLFNFLFFPQLVFIFLRFLLLYLYPEASISCYFFFFSLLGFIFLIYFTSSFSQFSYSSFSLFFVSCVIPFNLLYNDNVESIKALFLCWFIYSHFLIFLFSFPLYVAFSSPHFFFYNFCVSLSLPSFFSFPSDFPKHFTAISFSFSRRGSYEWRLLIGQTV